MVPCFSRLDVFKFASSPVDTTYLPSEPSELNVPLKFAMPQLPSQSIPGPQRAERADRISDAVWEGHREKVKRLYIDQGIRLEDLVKQMEEEDGFKASEQQYKIQFSKWNLRKNKRRFDQQASSPEPEQRRRPHPNTLLHESTPCDNVQLGDYGGMSLGAMDANINPWSFVQPAGPDFFSMPAANPYVPLIYYPPHGTQHAPVNVQPTQPPMYSQIQQLSVQSGSQTAQGRFQLNHYNIVDGGGGGGGQFPTRQMSRGATGAEPSRQAIHLAVQSGSLRGTKLLLDANPECAHVLDKEGVSPACLAAQGGYADILRLLITHKVELNVPSRDNHFPIHGAAYSGYANVVEMLLHNGADPDPVSNSDATPLLYAAHGGHYDVVKMLLDYRSPSGKVVEVEAEFSESERRPIHQAAEGGYLKTVQLLLEKGAECDPVDSNGYTPLWSASQNGHVDVVRELLKAGARVDAMPYMRNRQPIHQAAQGGHFELVSLFLDRGADINTKGSTGRGPLHFAACRGHVKVGQLLIDKGCDVDGREARGWSPLMLAAQDGHLSFVNLLVDNYANVHSSETDGVTGLLIAAQQGHASIVKRLLRAGAKQLASKKTGRRPLHQAAQNGHLACVKLLLEHSPE
ncbi:ankyrin repeat-containing domain protein, partial [Chaetomium tenue]